MLLSVSVLLSLVFSVSVSATDIESKDFHIHIETRTYSDTITGNMGINVLDVYPNNDIQEKAEYYYPVGIPAGSNYIWTTNVFTIRYSDDEYLLKKGRKSTLTLNNAYISMLITRNGTINSYYRNIDDYRCLIYSFVPST